MATTGMPIPPDFPCRRQRAPAALAVQRNQHAGGVGTGARISASEGANGGAGGDQRHRRSGRGRPAGHRSAGRPAGSLASFAVEEGQVAAVLAGQGPQPTLAARAMPLWAGPNSVEGDARAQGRRRVSAAEASQGRA